MSDGITFYTNPMSRGQIARWMLEEVGAPYDQVLLDYGTTMKAPEYLAINPMGKVPAIVHRGAAFRGLRHQRHHGPERQTVVGVDNDSNARRRSIRQCAVRHTIGVCAVNW